MFFNIIFDKLSKTDFPPAEKPLLTWDGDCGFCHYWMLRWKLITGENVDYRPYKEAAKNFPDIEYKYFKQAVRLIDIDGRIYDGPGAVFRAFEYGSKYRWIMPLYRRIRLFEWVVDHFYSIVSRNRSLMYKITVRLWGKNPVRQKNYWAWYLGGLTVLLGGLLFVV